jgi:hypothetical protein
MDEWLTETSEAFRWLCISVNPSTLEFRGCWQYLVLFQLNQCIPFSRLVSPIKLCGPFKLPLRIKVFCWLVIKNRILTKDNLKKKGWKKVEMCEFCDDYETQEHMFFLCPLAKYIWNVVVFLWGLVRYLNALLIYIEIGSTHIRAEIGRL